VKIWRYVDLAKFVSMVATGNHNAKKIVIRMSPPARPGRGAYTSVSAAHDAISVRFEQRRSYYANLLEVYGVTDTHLEAGGN
jgi:hypothetical protein